MYTFWKANAKAPYKYVGTYLLDVNASKPRRHIYRRLYSEIDLSPWYDQINFGYLQDNSQGSAGYKKFYFKGSQAKQKQCVDVFRQDISNYKVDEDRYLSSLRLVQE